MKLPEYLLSTPRLIAVLLTLALIALTGKGLIEPKDFVSIVTLVLGYFFGSRGSEKKSDTGEVMN
jgi:hypothetical protein